MQRLSLRFQLLLILMIASVLTARAQDDTTRPTSVDPKLLEWENARIPREYTIADVSIRGIRHLDTAIVLSISGLQTGDKFMHPGSDIFAKAIANMWRQKLFAGVQIYVTKIVDDRVSIEISVEERPRLGNFKFIGIKKTEAEELQGKIGLAKQTLITENMRRNIHEVTTKFYREKGFENVKIRIEEKPDPSYANSNSMNIYVDKGKKVRIDEVNFFENENVSELKLKKQMK
ncbi:MAG TPA: POTRA domain-containing protein, partial [Chitinophagaceae bacterium]|nr:POTRA domain-containing protein [Chitinophagaceae bacterium]